jgi:heat-inducible transcriptional repressor
MRTIFVEVAGEIADGVLAEVAWVLNQRLGGLSLREIRSSLATRLRDAAAGPETSELLNVFLEEGEQLFDVAPPLEKESVVLGQASVLADQPEFATGDSMRRLIELTDTRHDLGDLLRRRSSSAGLSITIGNEHNDPRFERFTVVTAEYRAGSLSGVIGVIGPTRMPYDKVISLVRHTSQLVSDLLD